MTWPWAFCETPTFYVTFMQYIVIISTAILFFGIVCIYEYTPSMDKRTRRLLVINMVCGYVAQGITTLSIPVILAPATAAYTLGLLNSFNMSTCTQFILILQAIAIHGATAFLIFFDRYVMIVGTRASTRRVVYSVVFVISIMTPTPLMVQQCVRTDFSEVKKEYFQKMGQSYAALLRHETIAFETGVEKTFTWILVYGTCVVTAMFASILFCGIHICKSLLNIAAKSTSTKQTAKHTWGIYFILIQTIIYFFAFFLPLTTLACLMFFEFPAPGLANLAVMIYTLADPLGVLVLIIGSRSIQRMYRKMFIKNVTLAVRWIRNGEKSDKDQVVFTSF